MHPTIQTEIIKSRPDNTPAYDLARRQEAVELPGQPGHVGVVAGIGAEHQGGHVAGPIDVPFSWDGGGAFGFGCIANLDHRASGSCLLMAAGM